MSTLSPGFSTLKSHGKIKQNNRRVASTLNGMEQLPGENNYVETGFSAWESDG